MLPSTLSDFLSLVSLSTLRVDCLLVPLEKEALPIIFSTLPENSQQLGEPPRSERWARSLPLLWVGERQARLRGVGEDAHGGEWVRRSRVLLPCSAPGAGRAERVSRGRMGMSRAAGTRKSERCGAKSPGFVTSTASTSRSFPSQPRARRAGGHRSIEHARRLRLNLAGVVLGREAAAVRAKSCRCLRTRARQGCPSRTAKGDARVTATPRESASPR